MQGKRVIVTGVAGFLGFFVGERLRQTGWCGEIFVPRSREYDPREKGAILRLYQNTRPHIVIY
jgi:GDP-L-fucose synthase